MKRLLAILLVAFPVESASAQFLPGNCPGRWINSGGGYACLCPNGTLANGWPPVCSGGPSPTNIPPGSTHCGGGRYCKPGLKCASGGKCVEKDVVDCGSGKFCAAGTKCSKQGGCIANDAVDCGSFSCKAGAVCAANSKCVSVAHARRLRGGGSLDAQTAQNVRPAALLLSEARSGSGNAAAKLGYRRSGEWAALLAKSGKPKTEVEEWRKAGFNATVFTRGSAQSGRREIVIAFLGPEPRGLPPDKLRDWIKSNWPSRTVGPTPVPFERAAEFARLVQKQFDASDRISVIGFSLGGTLASFVGNLLKLETTTFNAPTQSLAPVPRLGDEAAPNLTNIITAGDTISDPLADPDEGKLTAEARPLPGQTFVVDPPSAGTSHELGHVTKYIDELLRKQAG